MFKPYIVIRSGEFAIARRYWWCIQYNRTRYSFVWSFKSDSAERYATYSDAKAHLETLINPPKWVPAKSPIQINAPTV